MVGQWETLLARSGSEGVALAATERPDVILLDVMMPEIDGPATLRRLRDEPTTSAIPVIFMTAKVQKSEVSRFLELGAAGVIPKPFDPMTLPHQIRQIMGRQ
jgi:CheY-like chemotaxis protein